MANPFKGREKPISASGAPEMAAEARDPAERIEHDAGLSPGALQSGAAAGAAIGGRRGRDAIGDRPEKDTD